MKKLLIFLTLLSTTAFAQPSAESSPIPVEVYVQSVNNLTLIGAVDIAQRVMAKAHALDKTVTLAILDAAGNTVLLMKGDGVGPHNTEAARRKAYTALSTKTPTLQLMRNAASNNDSKNLNTLPELLLLSGGAPIWYKGAIIGSIGVAGGGSAENDDLLAKSATIPEMGITTSK